MYAEIYLICTFCQKYLVFQDRWPFVVVVSRDKFHCLIKHQNIFPSTCIHTIYQMELKLKPSHAFISIQGLKHHSAIFNYTYDFYFPLDESESSNNIYAANMFRYRVTYMYGSSSLLHELTIHTCTIIFTEFFESSHVNFLVRERNQGACI